MKLKFIPYLIKKCHELLEGEINFQCKLLFLYLSDKKKKGINVLRISN